MSYPSNESEYWNEKYNLEERLIKLNSNYNNEVYEKCRPSSIYSPGLSIDGNQWCALYGKDLQSGVAGFGDSPADAFLDFDKEWVQPLPEKYLKEPGQ